MRYARPEGPALELETQPRLASWDAASHPSQLRLRHYLQHAAGLVAPTLGAMTGSWSLWLDVGLPETVPVLDQHDLDNFAYPLAQHLSRETTSGLVSVWCTKSHRASSFIRVGPAVARPDLDGASTISVHTTASASSSAYKQQIHEQVARHAVALPDGPVALELAFTVGRRNWLNLWKPTIDALEPLLGRTTPGRNWHPRDGRITDLGLHLAKDLSLGYAVRIDILASAG
ncbi:hypothetical protein SAMN05421678_111207 [Actinopolymorpha cephalotaxi]|uniref:Uncharacterized protein n=1 Tax=Actinopolymorpha cephalotaxi TaxID=504797 RepID=A0A1I2X0C2_9ACTN|nr:hypothetical protein [Actinopolymorpha cephalotaxi]NYH85236.1 hypothetical protein [Actinopolymorpha cephalotaxi]SFH06965.1 hypothetical protein SAMN05421678_111207 [Actinopolymorpha cephalotaxi]